jgi:DNA-binding CsgD family transcriptional regulator
MQRWYSVGIDATSDPYSEDQFDAVIGVAEDIDTLTGPAFAGLGGGDGIGVQASIKAASPSEAAALVVDGFRAACAKAGIRLRDIGRVDVMTEEYLDRWVGVSPPELVGVAEVAELLAVSKQRVSELHRREDFPEPVAVLATGPIWQLPAVKAFASTWARRPGRPALDMNAIVAEELEHIPRGPRGSAQNTLRMVYQAMRKHSLAGIVKSPWEVLFDALAQVRSSYPDQRLRYDEDWFRSRQEPGELLAGRRRRQRGAEAAPVSDSPEISQTLTRRELRIVQLLSEGETDRQIAERLSLDVSVVRDDIRAILEKLRATSRREAVARYAQSSESRAG